MRLSDRYYTGREVQRLLNITEPALRNLVQQRRLRKVIPPGRQTGVYLKEEVDTFAEKWLAFLSDTEPPSTTFETASAEDMQSEYDISKRAIIPNTMSAELRRAWLDKNPEGNYVVKHNGKVVAFFQLLPVRHERLMQFMRGEIRGWDISPDDLDPFEPGKPVECLAMTASEPDVAESTRKHYMAILLRGLRNELEQLGRKGIVITNVYATSETPTGISMSLHAAMQEFGSPLGKRRAFVMNLEQSPMFLTEAYRRGLDEWKQAQSSKRSSART